MLGLLLGGTSWPSCRAGRSLGLVAFDKVAREDALLLDTVVVDVFSAIPIGVLLIGNGDDLAGGEVEIVLMTRVVLEDGFDLEQRHDDAAVGISTPSGPSVVVSKYRVEVRSGGELR